MSILSLFLTMMTDDDFGEGTGESKASVLQC